MAQQSVRYTVQGTGSFPLDMLRYDQSTFASEEAANEAERSIMEFGLHPTRVWSVDVVKHCHNAAEALSFLRSLDEAHGRRARWHSFGWLITAVGGRW